MRDLRIRFRKKAERKPYRYNYHSYGYVISLPQYKITKFCEDDHRTQTTSFRVAFLMLHFTQAFVPISSSFARKGMCWSVFVLNHHTTSGLLEGTPLTITQRGSAVWIRLRAFARPQFINSWSPPLFGGESLTGHHAAHITQNKLKKTTLAYLRRHIRNNIKTKVAT